MPNTKNTKMNLYSGRIHKVIEGTVLLVRCWQMQLELQCVMVAPEDKFGSEKHWKVSCHKLKDGLW